MSASLFLPYGSKLRCTVCGRTGYRGGRWAQACEAGHPHRCTTCGRRFSTPSGIASHRRHQRAGHQGCEPPEPAEHLPSWETRPSPHGPRAPSSVRAVCSCADWWSHWSTVTGPLQREHAQHVAAATLAGR